MVYFLNIEKYIYTFESQDVAFMDKKENCCCFTGHRAISSEHIVKMNKTLPRLITKLAGSGICDFITGGALGFDTFAAKHVLKARKDNPKIHLILALPCREQAKSWRKKDMLVYDEIKNLADEVIFVSENYDAGCMHRRNRFMVDNSESCVFYMTSPRGGTAYTVKYAIKSELILYNIMSLE